ncbi:MULTISPECIES: hypothetical protein [Aequorivita]|uniref:Uncharacterized protein n=1 Tax=Aequorivita iocasae TaxID=2803865 RepID=A0ABX7DQJ2_9FLAO|nr:MULTISPECIES: hypothetical protein [Aequorivita]QQX76400.1 hypothetical protein JK629_13900 [Aequorivita iocasae]UCA55870.1 hypothetical protein LDL78_13970 [Aequorivita sp. F7]
MQLRYIPVWRVQWCAMAVHGVQECARVCNGVQSRYILGRGVKADAMVVHFNPLVLIAGRGEPWSAIGFDCVQFQSIPFNYLDNSYLPITLAVIN